jgi:hypothetical protein
VAAAPTTRETFAELATSGRLLFGHGPGNFGLAMGATYDAGTRNLFIDAIVDAGVPAGLLFGLFWLVALCRAWRYLAEAGTAGGPPATHDVPAHLPWLALVSMTVVGVLVGLRLDHLGTMLHASVLWLAIASTARPAVAAAEPRAVGPTLADRGFRFTPRSRPSWLVACLQVGTGLVVAWALGAFSLFKPMVAPSGTDMHADVSLELAVNRALCGRTSHLGHTSIAEALRRRPDLLKLPVLEVPAAVAGSTAEYCASVNRPFLNNENGMTFLLAAALRLRPGLTLAALGNAMRVFRMACWAVFLLAAARAGAPWLFLVVAWYLALRVNAGVELTHPYSVYPYFAPLLFGYAGLLALMVAACRGRGMSRSLLALFVAGALTGLAASVRSSHLPVYACMTLAAACFIVPLRLRPPVRASLARTAALLLAWAAGWMAFQRTFIAPIESLPTTSNRSYHVVAHPLVLALAVPPNPLAEREGIQWSDLVGIDLARRVDPSATYLGPTYERALFTYYGSLWNRFPLEMLGVYAKKWALAGTNVRLANERPVIERVFQLLLLPYTAIRHGGVLMAVLAGLALVAGTRVRWNPEARALPVFVLLVALLLLVECTIILPDFRLVYHAPLLMVMVLVVWLAVCLAVVELVAWIVRSSQRAPAGGRRVTPVNLSPSADGAAGDVTS